MASGPDQEYIHFIGSETLPSACYILSDSGKRFLLPVTYFPTNPDTPTHSTSNGYNHTRVYFYYASNGYKNTLMRRPKSDPNLKWVIKANLVCDIKFLSTPSLKYPTKKKSLGIKNPEHAVVKKSDKKKSLGIKISSADQRNDLLNEIIYYYQ